MGKRKPQAKGMRTMQINRGLPASGKSTATAEQLKKEPGRWVVVNKDAIRRGLIGNLWSADIEDLVHELSETMLKAALDSGFDVIVDNTHLTQKSINKLHKIASERGNTLVMEKVFPVKADECLRRNAAREGVARVPENIMLSMIHGAGIDKHGYRDFADKQTYYEPLATAEKVVNDPKLPSAVLCDLDGTLALIHNRDPYDASRCDEVDIPNVPVVETLKALWEKGHKIIFMSGRDSKYRAATVRFIEKHCPWLMSQANDFPGCRTHAYSLYMRVEGDMRKDSIIKHELFDAHVKGQYNVLLVLDDRNQVVNLWRRELGLTCFQVEFGDF
jgi:predicted kinase